MQDRTAPTVPRARAAPARLPRPALRPLLATALLALAACGTRVDVPAPDTAAATLPFPEPPPSVVTLPISLELGAVVRKVEGLVPRTQSREDEWHPMGKVPVLGTLYVKEMWERDPLEVGLDGGGVEVSAQEAGLAGLIPWSVAMQDYLSVNPLLPAEGHRNADGAYWVLPASDGWVRVVVGSPRQWVGFKTLMRNPDVFEAEEWRNPQFRLANSDVIRMLAQDLLTDRTRAELFTEALELGATVGVLHQPSEFVEHPQTRSRSFFVESDVPGIEGLPCATQPVIEMSAVFS